MTRRHVVFGGLIGICTLGLRVRIPGMRPPGRHSEQAGDGLRITRPADGDRVSARAQIEGVFATPGIEIWSVIHPMSGSDHWVQLPTRSRDGGRWSLEAAFGEPGPMHRGISYEVMVFVGPTQRLRPGLILSDWPAARLSSTMIQVTRA